MAKSKTKKRKSFSVANAKKNAGNTVLENFSSVTGAVISRGIEALVNTDYKQYAKAGMLALGVLGAASVSGNGTAETIAKGAAKGVAIYQGITFATDGLKSVIDKKENAKGFDLFLNGVSGLGSGVAQYTPRITAPINWNRRQPAGKSELAV